MRLAAGRCSGYNKRRQENGGRKRFLPPSNFESEKSMTMSFTGFYPETIDFLWGIRLNNNREWFEAHKADYQRFLWEPMKALAADVEAAFTGVEGLRMRVSRIYRDMRMHPPVPYKETSWMCLRHDGASWLEHPCLFFELTSEGYSYGLLLWNPRAGSTAAGRSCSPRSSARKTGTGAPASLRRRGAGTSTTFPYTARAGACAYRGKCVKRASAGPRRP